MFRSSTAVREQLFKHQEFTHTFVKQLLHSPSLTVAIVYIRLSLFLILLMLSGVSANADPHTNKLRIRVTHIWGYRRRQLNLSAMGEPLPGGTAWMITVSSIPGKYADARQ